jgi:antitoxin ParD1/3/4
MDAPETLREGRAPPTIRRMGKLAPLTVDVPEDLAAALRAAVARGESASVSEAVADAVEAWLHRHDPETPEQTARLRRLVEEGIASGPGRFATSEDLLADIHRRHAARLPSGD